MSSPKQADTGSLINQQAGASFINQASPFGSITYSGKKRISIPGEPDAFVPRSATTTLSPAQQRLLEQQQKAQQLLGATGIGLAGQFPRRPMGAFDPKFDGVQARFSPTFRGTQAAFNPGSFEASRNAAEQAVFQRGLSLLNPEFDRQERAMQQRLANQGLPQASEAYGAETGRFAQNRNQAMESLAQAAVLQGLQAQQQGYGQALGTYQTEAGRRAQQFGQDLQGWQAEAARRQQQFGQDLQGYQASQAGRAQQLQEILGLFGQQQTQLPQQLNMPQIQVPFGQQQQQGANPMAGLLALGGMGLGAAFGGPAGAQFGFTAGSQLPGLFGY